MTPEEALDGIYERIKVDPSFVYLRQSPDAPFPAPFVPGEGATEGCKAFVIGEAPGAHEAIKRRPFIGPAGKVQRQLMSIARLQADPLSDSVETPANCWLTNVLHYRPPRNRRPTTKEIEASRPYIVEEWRAVGRPRLVIPVGGAALEALLGHAMSILKTAGQLMVRKDMDAREIFVWPMIHPSFGLRQRNVQPLIERDWHRLAEWMRASYQ